jgi:hypothetical protein
VAVGMSDDNLPLERRELDQMLDGDLSTYTPYRWSVVLLLGGAGYSFRPYFLTCVHGRT